MGIFNPLNADLNPIYHLLALLGAHHIFHVSGLRFNRFSDIEGGWWPVDCLFQGLVRHIKVCCDVSRERTAAFFRMTL